MFFPRKVQCCIWGCYGPGGVTKLPAIIFFKDSALGGDNASTLLSQMDLTNFDIVPQVELNGFFFFYVLLSICNGLFFCAYL